MGLTKRILKVVEYKLHLKVNKSDVTIQSVVERRRTVFQHFLMCTLTMEQEFWKVSIIGMEHYIKVQDWFESL